MTIFYHSEQMTWLHYLRYTVIYIDGPVCVWASLWYRRHLSLHSIVLDDSYARAPGPAAAATAAAAARGPLGLLPSRT